MRVDLGGWRSGVWAWTWGECLCIRTNPVGGSSAGTAQEGTPDLRTSWWPCLTWEKVALYVLSEDRDNLETQPHLRPRGQLVPSPPCPCTLQEDLQLGVAHIEVAAPHAVLLCHGRAALLQDVLGEAAPVLGDGPLLLPLADEAHLARAVGLAAVGHVAGTQQLLCGHEEGTHCAMGSPHCPPGSFGGFGDRDIVLKTPEPNFESGQPHRRRGRLL